jgi:hypothetical protein
MSELGLEIGDFRIRRQSQIANRESSRFDESVYVASRRKLEI